MSLPLLFSELYVFGYWSALVWFLVCQEKGKAAQFKKKKKTKQKKGNYVYNAIGRIEAKRMNQ
jgi:hypothetical protein